MGARGRELALARHTPAVVGERYRDLLRRAAGQMSRRGERRSGAAAHAARARRGGSPPAPSPPASSSPGRSPASGSRTSATASPGSSNVARSVGWKPAAAVLALDALKAYVPATAARLPGAGDGAVAAVGIWAMCGHIAVVKGRGAASALGAAFAMDPAMMAVGCVPLLGGSLAAPSRARPWPSRRSRCRSSASRCTAARAARSGRSLLITVLFAARIKGSPGAPLPDSPEVLWQRFWLDRDD